ncbi:hypothetical protein DFQ27_005148 [Actinomortierella ambigua]|uniref:Sugar phosphate transporter domain-containing protein n=1 Tax=Actinomortierella ambigua TaxID=1343610 RepID=A0A9P6PZL7_9FUNG|nr:hypothetical protein DFQ27_005148 [Actinomortierella ambigua]
MASGNISLTERQAVLLTVAFYMFSTCAMVLANKYALNAMPVAWLLLWCQMAIAVLLLKVTEAFGVLRMPQINLVTAKALIPLITINVLGLGVNTLCLIYVDTSFYQVARGLVLPFTVIFAYAFLRQSSSKTVLIACFIVFCGFYTGVTSDINVSSLGVFFGIVSSITTSLHAIVIKQSLSAVNNSSIDLVYYNNLLSFIVITPIILFSGEISAVSEHYAQEGSAVLHKFFFGVILTGVLGFMVNLAGFLQISKTSPTTHMISGAVRGVLQTFLGYMVFSEVITFGRMAGIVLILAGGALYTWAKDQEMRANTKPTYIPMTQQDIDEEDQDGHKA